MEAVGRDLGLRSRAPLLALLAANAVSMTGNALTRVAVPWFVLSTGGSAAQVGLTLFLETLPLFLGSFFGGVLVDKLGHKRSSVVADLASGATLALVPLLHALGALPFGLLLGLVFAGALLDAPGTAARQALVPEAAKGAGEGLERANAAYQTVLRLSALLGPVVGGALVAVVGATGVLLVDAATFALSALVIGALVPGASGGQHSAKSRGETKGSKGYAADLAGGLRFVWRTGPLRTVVGATTILTLFASPIYYVILPVYLKQEYGEAMGLGLLFSAFGGGAVLGAVGYGFLGKRISRRTLYLLGAFGVALAAAANVALPPLPVILAASAVVGVAFGPLGALVGVIAGEHSPPELRGRVFGLVAAAVQLATPVGSLLVGYLLEVAPVRVAIAALAAGCAVVALAGPFDPALGKMERSDEEPARADAAGSRGNSVG
jgi:MFS family permease